LGLHCLSYFKLASVIVEFPNFGYTASEALPFNLNAGEVKIRKGRKSNAIVCHENGQLCMNILKVLRLNKRKAEKYPDCARR
jgi:hypothetical protein